MEPFLFLVPEPFSFLVPEPFWFLTYGTFPLCTDLTYLILKPHITIHITS